MNEKLKELKYLILLTCGFMTYNILLPYNNYFLMGFMFFVAYLSLFTVHFSKSVYSFFYAFSNIAMMSVFCVGLLNIADTSAKLIVTCLMLFLATASYLKEKKLVLAKA